jgi:hypothetical protein
LHFPDSIKLDEVRFDRDIGEICGEKFCGTQQFASMVNGLRFAIALELSEPTVGAQSE